MTWVVRLAKIGADGEEQWVDVAQIARPGDLGDIANLGLTMAEGKLVLAGLQQEFVAGQAREHAAVCRPGCRICGSVCCVKDYREHQVATLFGCAAVRLARFCCARCGVIEAGNEWPLHCRSTPELDRFQAHLSALMPYREAAGMLAQMLPLDGGKHHETLRRHTLRTGEELRNRATPKLETTASAIDTSLDSTFIRSCQDGERHLEVMVGNVETAAGGRRAKDIMRPGDHGFLAAVLGPGMLGRKAHRDRLKPGGLCRTPEGTTGPPFGDGVISFKGAVHHRASNLEHQVRTARRPTHLLLGIHPAM